MDESFIKLMKIKLLAQKKEILKALVSENDDFKAIVKDLDPKDLVDIAADDIDRTTLSAIGAQEIKRLRLIDSAISRIKNNRYGLCMRCNKKIPKERLEAIPYAMMCIKCKTSDERKNR